jgi:hypothetical protein
MSDDESGGRIITGLASKPTPMLRLGGIIA